MSRMIKCFRKECETIFESINGAKYCCDDCQRQVRNAKQEEYRRKKGVKKIGTRDYGCGICPVCETKFKRKSYQHTYCKKKCRQAEEQRLRAEKAKDEPAPKDYFEYQPGDFSHEQYEREQKELDKPNGRKCKYWQNFGHGGGDKDCSPGSPAELTGNDRMYCKKHQDVVKRKSVVFRCDGNYGNEAVIDWERF